MSLLALATIAMWTAAAVCLAWYAASVAGEVTYVTLADGRRQERSLPLAYKMLLPFVGNCSRLVALPFFARQVEAAEVQLVAAGYEGLLTGREFVSLKLLLPMVVAPVGALAVLWLSALSPELGSPAAMLAVLAVAVAYFQPLAWLRRALKRRHLSIQKSLPFVLDLLTLSVEAGMDFISALQRNCRLRRLDPLNEELLRMTKEIQVGASRREALRQMADRVRQPDLRAVAHALIQADELGVSIGSILRIQSEQLRARRFDRAEKLASEAPVKMLGPLMLCIFPAVFIILLGPILSQAMKGL
ncbi:MAG: type II secretion system F family protein [Kiritimatiellia bacterium]